MSSKLTVLFYIFLCLEVGVMLTLLPWIPQGFFGLSDWGNNYFLLYAANKTGLQGLQQAISSGWVRGAVSGLGVLNLLIAFWEITHFRQTVRVLQGSGSSAPPDTSKDAARPASPDHIPDHQRRGDESNAGN
ncbi:MAG: hypothetical protein H7Y30_02030 [Pyrinomonadaceae bacterium]|nr:hypothetical protein [Pyrinomonadaceae bacterium]